MKLLLPFVFFFLFSPYLSAHNVVGGVYSLGATIEGEAGFSNGAMAKAGTVVKIFDESGIPLGEVLTDDEGFFVFTAKKRITHVFEINMGAGHTLKMQLPAEELPDNLQGAPHTVTSSQRTVPAVSQLAQSSIDTEQLNIALAKQLKPLRQEIRALKEKAGLRDIIGGIGYIFGLLGLIALLRERRLKAQS